MTLTGHVRMLAAYNRWANQRLYAAVAALPDAEYHRDRRGQAHDILSQTGMELPELDLLYYMREAGV